VNTYDIFLIAIVLASIAMGLVKGLLREVFSLVGVILGVVIALVVSPHLGRSLAGIIPSESAAYAAAFLVLFLATLFVMSILSALSTRLLDMAKLGIPNRFLGGIFGLVRGVLTALIITLGLTLFLDEDSHLLAESRLVPHIAYGTRMLAPLLPGRVEQVLLDRVRNLPGGPGRDRI